MGMQHRGDTLRPIFYIAVASLVEHEEQWEHQECCRNAAVKPINTTALLHCLLRRVTVGSRSKTEFSKFTILYMNPLPSTWKTKPCSFGRMSKQRIVLTGFGSGFPELAKWVKSCWPMKRNAACLQEPNTYHTRQKRFATSRWGSVIYRQANAVCSTGTAQHLPKSK